MRILYGPLGPALVLSSYFPLGTAGPTNQTMANTQTAVGLFSYTQSLHVF